RWLTALSFLLALTGERQRVPATYDRLRRRNSSVRRSREPRVCYGRASNTRLNGVSATRRKRVKPAASTTSLILASPACAPSASPTSCESEAGVHSSVEKA